MLPSTMDPVSMLAKGKSIKLGDFFQSQFSALQQPRRSFPSPRIQIPVSRWRPNTTAASSSTAPPLTQWYPAKETSFHQDPKSKPSSSGKDAPLSVSDFPPLPNRTNPNTMAEKGGSPQDPPLLTHFQPPHTKSFREAVSAPWAQSIDVSFPSMSTKVPSTYMGEPAFIISEEEELRLAQSFQYALIGKFMRGRPPMAAIRKTVLAAGFQGECHIGLIDYRHIVFQFQLQSDFHRLWLKKNWTCDGFNAKIFRWTPDFSPEKKTSIVPIWVNFPLLPLHLCKKDILYSLGSVVGVPLKLDLATAAMDRVLRPSEARLCIEVDLLKKLPQRVWTGTEGKCKWQPIQYENLPEFCSKCSMLGHTDSYCKNQLSAPVTKVWVRKKNPVQMPKDSTASEADTVPSSAENDELEKAQPQVQICNGGGNGSCDDRENIELPHQNSKNGNCPLAIVEYSTAPTQVLPTIYEENNIRQFFTFLGQFLEFINNEEKDTEVSVLCPSTIDSPKDDQTAPTSKDPVRSKGLEQPSFELCDEGTEEFLLKRQDKVSDSPDIEPFMRPKINDVISKATDAVTSKLPMIAAVAASKTPPLNETVEEERRSCSHAAPAATAVADHAAPAAAADGELMEFVLEANLSGKQMGSTVWDLDGLSGKNYPCISVVLEANLSGKQMGSTEWDLDGLSGKNYPCISVGPVVLSEPTIGEGNKEENARELADLSGQQKGSTESEENLSLASNTLSAQELTHAPNVRDVEVIREQTTSNAVAESVGKVMTWDNVSGFKMVASEQTMELDKDSGVSGFIADRPKGLSILNDAWSNLVGLSHITTEFQTNENCWEEESDSVQSAGVSPSESLAYFANIFSRANLEDEKKRKYGMSDRVLRSILRASNTDPTRPGSL